MALVVGLMPRDGGESGTCEPDAFDCANEETEAVFAAFTSALAQAGVAPAALAGAPEEDAEWPTRASVCQFLLEAANWDGEDRRWNNALVRPALTNQLIRAITADDESIGDVCAGDPEALALPQPPRSSTPAPIRWRSIGASSSTRSASAIGTTRRTPTIRGAAVDSAGGRRASGDDIVGSRRWMLDGNQRIAGFGAGVDRRVRRHGAHAPASRVR